MFLTEEIILGKGVGIVWTDIQTLSEAFGSNPQRDAVFEEKQLSFTRKTICSNTLVIEPINCFFKLINPNVGASIMREHLQSKLGDQSIKQAKTVIDNQLYIALIQIWPMGLIKHLKKLAKYYELVVYTILPGDILEQIFDMVPGIRDVISHSLCYNELIFDGTTAWKDLSYLAMNRKINTI